MNSMMDRRHLTGDNIRFYVNISLDKFKANLGSMPLGTAVDGNGDGIIQIGHNDPMETAN